MELSLNLNAIAIEKKNTCRQLLINTFIKKFPKVKLETIINVNKYYNYNKNKYDKFNINDIINEYLKNN